MTEQVATAWHHICTNPDCGIQMTVAFESGDVRQSVPKPREPDTGCMICGSPWGPWLAGDAPEDDEE